jgi:DNA-binding NtrC family response regulator
VANESFRSDLLYRINGFQIDLAPLRERPEDIEPLARHLLNDVGGSTPPQLEAESLDALRAYSWPGNVRQLKNCLERAVILSNNGRITINELPPEVVRPSLPTAAMVSAVPSGINADPNAGVVQFTPGAPTSPTSLRDVERQQILAALEQTGWHRGKTAEILGISPSTLYRRLRDYNLEHRNG